MPQHLISLHNALARNPLLRLGAPVSLDVDLGEHVAIVGPNGAGKSLLVDLLTGKLPLLEGFPCYDFSPSESQMAYDNIRYIAFRDTYGSADASYYYQQRWNQTEQEDVPTVRELLAWCRDEEAKSQLLSFLGLDTLIDKRIILLSSGELRKFQLAKAMLSRPRLLIMDNPFIGLDAPTRTMLGELLTKLAEEYGLHLILVLSMLDDIPPFITHVVPAEGLIVGEKLTRESYLEQFASADAARCAADEETLQKVERWVAEVPYSGTNFTGDEVVKLNRVSIRYEERTILSELDWMVKRGERWALTGDNGSGKSTLLSLVCADNPQSYACDIALFGRQRGSGESIWEIKKHIGYVSPEMHRAYLNNLPTIEIVASGLHDSIGLYLRPKSEEMAECLRWMEIFGIEGLKELPFMQLSSGEQRVALLARAFVKDPELLILDEPLHGLDTYNRRRVKRIIEAFCRRQDKTLVMVTHYANELPQSINKRKVLPSPLKGGRLT